MEKTRKISRFISLSGLLASSLSLHAAEGAPGIAITGTMDNSAKMIPVLKMDYRTCVMKHEGVQAAIEQGGVASVAVTNDLPPGYIVSAKPQAEPKWEETNVGKSRIEEYFEGDKYAHYTYGASHRFSDDGKCRLEEIEYVKIDLDDGEQKYRIKLEGKMSINSADGGSDSPVPMKYEYAVGSVKRQPSPVLSRGEANRGLQKLAGLLKEHPEIMQQLSKGVVPEADAADSAPPGGVGQSGPAPGNVPASGGDTLSRIKESLGYSKNTYQQPGQTMLTESFVAGQACDIVNMDGLNSRMWYWHRMNNYPATMSRPIILKKEHSLADGESYRTTYEADSFRSDVDIDDILFRPEPKLRKPGRWRHPLFEAKAQKRVQVPIPEKGSFAYDQFMLAMMIDVIQKRKDMSWEEKDEKIKSLRLAYDEGRLQSVWNRMD